VRDSEGKQRWVLGEEIAVDDSSEALPRRHVASTLKGKASTWKERNYALSQATFRLARKVTVKNQIGSKKRKKGGPEWADLPAAIARSEISWRGGGVKEVKRKEEESNLPFNCSSPGNDAEVAKKKGRDHSDWTNRLADSVKGTVPPISGETRVQGKRNGFPRLG